jgi:hypothetical protein
VLAAGAGVLVAWSAGVGERLVDLARYFPGLAPLADGLAVVDQAGEGLQAVVLYLAVWWATLPVKAVCAYLEEDALRLEVGKAADPVTLRSAVYTIVGTPLAWVISALAFSSIGHKLATGLADRADPVSLEFALLIGPLVNGPVLAWAVWSLYGFLIALLSICLVEIGNLACSRIGAALPAALTKRRTGGPDA